MQLTLRKLAMGVGALGVAIGVSFGAGVAVGRGDPKEAEGGLTQQQIQALIGGGGGGFCCRE